MHDLTSMPIISEYLVTTGMEAIPCILKFI